MDFSNVDLALGTLTAYDSGSSVSSGRYSISFAASIPQKSSIFFQFSVLNPFPPFLFWFLLPDGNDSGSRSSCLLY